MRSVLVVGVLLTLRWLAMTLLRRNVGNVANRYKWSRGLTTIVSVLFVLFLGATWFSSLDIWEQVLERFAERDDINLAYPTIRYYQQ